MEVKIQNIKEFEGEMVDKFLCQFDNTLLYSSQSYLRLLSDYLNCEIKVVIAIENGTLKGFLPIAIKTNGKEAVCNSLPYYGSNGGIIVLASVLAERDKIRKEIYKVARDYVISRSCVSFTIISSPLDPEGNQWLKDNTQYDLRDDRIGQITHFPKTGTEDLMSCFQDPRPRNIRKALKEGVTIAYSHSHEDIEFLYQTHLANITAIGGIPKSKRFFELLPKHFNERQFRVYTANMNGQKVAALLLFYFNRTVEYYTPATVEQFRNQQPTSLIIYEAMKDAMEMGFKNWNWGGTWLSQGGVYDFKKRWGTNDHPYFYYVRIFDESLLSKPREYFLKEFPNFYVVPFHALTT